MNGINWTHRNMFDGDDNLLTDWTDSNSNTLFDGTESRNSYTYDNNGNQLTETYETVADGIRFIKRYTYNNGNRLSDWTDSDNSGAFNGTESRYLYTFDNNGNQLTKTDETVADGIRWTRYKTYDNNGNELTQWRDNDNSGAFDNNESRYIYTFDNNGNQLTEAYETVADGIRWTRYKTYDNNGNNLTNWADSDNSGAFDNNESRYIYTYDNHGNRLTQTYDTVAGGVQWMKRYGYNTIDLAQDPCLPNPCDRPIYGYIARALAGIETVSTCRVGTLVDRVENQVVSGAFCVCSEEAEQSVPVESLEMENICVPSSVLGD
jgi:hypothetical protein